MSAVTTTDLTVGWSSAAPVLSGVNLELAAGVHCVTGPNGSGKTTLIRTIAGVIPPVAGTVEVNGEVGYLSHLPGIYSQLTVEDNLRQWASFLDSDNRSPHREVMESFDLAGIAGKKASTLSQGQRQRLGLARSFLGKPDVIFLDEPTAGMDPATKKATQKIIHAAGASACVIVTSHDLLEVSGIATTIVQISGSGTVHQQAASSVAALDTRRVRISLDADRLERAQAILGPAEPQRESSGWLAITVGKEFSLSKAIAALAAEGIEVRAIDDLEGLESYYRG